MNLYLYSLDSQEELPPTNMSQELFLPRAFLLAVFGGEFFPRKMTFILGEVILLGRFS
jgi:hypothetical protein